MGLYPEENFLLVLLIEQEFPQSSETGICSKYQHLITAVKQGFINVKLVCGKR